MGITGGSKEENVRAESKERTSMALNKSLSKE
jgi:hypothetical protein